MNLAPNGKKSNLTTKQYRLVRTTAFKKWFGDWEKDAENSSKVVDQNGEPLVVYHGTSQEFNEFYFKNLHYINGFYFTPSEDIAQDFAEASINPFLVKKRHPIIKECFLNIKNIADYDVTNFKKTRNDKSYNKFVHEFIDKNKIDGVVVNKDNAVKGGIKLSKKYLNMQELIEKGTEKEQYKVLNREFEYEQYIVFEPNQIKLADGTNTNFDANNPDIRFDNGGTTMKAPKLLAPNGKPSNLTPEQYRLVRTPKFKAWFGDWETDAENSSKVVDQNGEPLVVWHGSNKNFNKFQLNKANKNFESFWFTKDKDIIERGESGAEGTKYIRPFFLNIKTMAGYNEYEKYNYLDSRIVSAKKLNEFKAKFDGISLDDEPPYYIVFNSNKIKLADGTNTTFDANNPDIRYKNGGTTETGEIRSFPISKLIAYDWKINEVVDEIKKGELSYSKNEPSLLSYVPHLKKYLILDGHHRILEQKHDGKKNIMARISKYVPKTHNLSSETVSVNDKKYKNGGNMETEYKVIFESRSGSGNVREVRVSAKNFNDAKKKGWIKSGLNKKFYAFLTAHEIKAVGGMMAMQILSTGYTLHNNVKPYQYSIGGL